MTDIPPAWVTYHDKAVEHLDQADMSTGTHGGHLLQQTHTQMAIGWALLALVEVLKPQDDIVLEVSRDRQRVTGPPHSRCGECNQTTGNYHLSSCSKNAETS